jgi:hypothetical protein
MTSRSFQFDGVGPAPLDDPVSRALWLNAQLPGGSLYSDAKRPIHRESRASWRLSPEPFWITPQVGEYLERLGADLFALYRATNALYLASVRGTQPRWVAEYFDLGRPDALVDFGRLNRTRRALPGVIRPDLFLTDDGFVATELDSVPGGIGFGASMGRLYSALGITPVGGSDGMVDGFLAMVASAAGRKDPAVAIVVSDESGDYWDEMAWLAAACRARGASVHAVRPDAVTFREEGIFVPEGGSPGPRDDSSVDGDAPLVAVHVIYRFFELYDIKNVPKWELMLYAAKKQKVVITPPVKSYLEEKLSFALVHHPSLEKYWTSELTVSGFERVRSVIPQTWVLDPRPVPPHATIPGLAIGGAPLHDWRQLHGLGQKERRLVIKPSGFAATAWGSRGVRIGHDLPEAEWIDAIDAALADFTTTRHVLQRFHATKRATVQWYDFDSRTVRQMAGRARLTPYYFVAGDTVKLGGVTATVVPIDKKLIHGMVDAVMVPCAIRDGSGDGAT